MRQVILFGGTFDPVHTGHIEIAKAALKETKANELWFLLAAQSPFKDEGTSFYHRKKMLDLSISHHKKLKVCTIEERLPKPSYSIDTIKVLKKEYPNIQFKWLLGSDQIPHLNKWKDFDELNRLVEFIVYNRPQENHDHPYRIITGDFLDISSTEIRNGLSTETDPKVLNYFMRHNLYLDSILQTKLSEFRYQHTLRVKDLALEIGKCHHMDEDRIILMSMMHDYAKEDSNEALVSYVKGLDANQLVLAPAIYHGFAARSILSKNYYIKDRMVLRAIQGHVTGSNTNPYAMLLYIADKCERGRNYDSEAYINSAKQDLRKTFNQLKEVQRRYLKEKI